MKKELLILTLMLLVFPLAYAVNFDIKDSYKPGETLIGTLEGNFLSQLTQQNFYFYSDRSQIPLVFDIAKIQDKYYFYALLPAEERNYTLIVRDTSYYENGKEVKADLEKTFSVSGNVSDFSVYPGFIIMKNESSLTIESQSQSLIISAKFLNSSQTLQVPVAQKKKMIFSAQGISNFTMANIEISALNTEYLIPVAILSGISPEKENITETKRFRFNKEIYNFSVHEQNKTSFRIYLQNFGDKTIDNIRLGFSDTLKDTVTFSHDEIKELKESGLEAIDIIVDAKTYKTFQGTITASSENDSAETFITINSIEAGSSLPIDNGIYPVTGKESCVDLQGELCLEEQECSGTFEDTIEDNCCINGTCQEKTSYWSIIIGIIIILAVAAGLYFLYMRSRKAKISSEDILKKQEKKFEERNTEVRGNLARS